MDYMAIINHPNFRAANGIVHFAEKLLMEIGLTQAEARGWIRAWVSGAADGSE